MAWSVWKWLTTGLASVHLILISFVRISLCKKKNKYLLGKPHSTSKLSAFEDFKSLTTFGFRGEALNALAALKLLLDNAFLSFFDHRFTVT